MSYDKKCGDLARAFLQDAPPETRTLDNIEELAEKIQETIDDFMTELALERR